MENTTDGENDLEKLEDSRLETPSVEPDKKQTQVQGNAAEEPLKKVQDELAEARDKYLRLYAEFENHRRRTAREKLEMIQAANEQLIKSLLPVMDDFERAEKTFKDKNDKDSEGFFLIQNKLKKILEQFGVQAMAVEGDFNPDLHEAITQLPAPEGKLKGKILEVVEKGYLLNDKVVRCAKVVIGS